MMRLRQLQSRWSGSPQFRASASNLLGKHAGGRSNVCARAEESAMCSPDVAVTANVELLVVGHGLARVGDASAGVACKLQMAF